MKTFHQTPEEIIKAATPEQKILWNFIFREFGERVSISQLYYQGLIIGSEFATYTARKLYLALELDATGNAAVAAGLPVFTVYNELDAAINYYRSIAVYWDATAAAVRNLGTTMQLKNLYFSRVAGSLYLSIKFIGYRLTY